MKVFTAARKILGQPRRCVWPDSIVMRNADKGAYEFHRGIRQAITPYPDFAALRTGAKLMR